MALIKCVECGGQVSDKASNCPNCGCPLGIMPHGMSVGSQSSELSDLRLDSPESRGNMGQQNTADEYLMNEEYYEAAIGKKADYYLEKFRKIADGAITINWAAFIFSSTWLLYRKMYLQYFILYGISFLIGIIIAFIPKLIPYTNEITIIYMVIYSFFYMFFGNTLYKKHIEKKIKLAQIKNRSRYTAITWLRYYGGTSKLACFIGIVVYVILSVFAIFSEQIEQKIQQEEMKQQQHQPVNRSGFTPIKHNIIYGKVEIMPIPCMSYRDSRV